VNGFIVLPIIDSAASSLLRQKWFEISYIVDVEVPT